MEINKMFNLLHLARKSGKVKFGYQETLRMIQAKKARLVLVANDISENTKKKLEKVLAGSHLELIMISSMQNISQQLSIKKTGILCVIDENFAKGISRQLGYEWRNNGDKSS
jgi:ribosomal protein L7Ae-like RNA K-turn-binding protein